MPHMLERRKSGKCRHGRDSLHRTTGQEELWCVGIQGRRCACHRRKSHKVGDFPHELHSHILCSCQLLPFERCRGASVRRQIAYARTALSGLPFRFRSPGFCKGDNRSTPPQSIYECKRNKTNVDRVPYGRLSQASHPCRWYRWWTSFNLVEGVDQTLSSTKQKTKSAVPDPSNF
jgi:hypothetical protein